jgi:hypothetical protein
MCTHILGRVGSLHFPPIKIEFTKNLDFSNDCCIILRCAYFCAKFCPYSRGVKMKQASKVLGIRLDPKPTPRSRGDRRFQTTVSMEGGQFFKPHSHPIRKISKLDLRRFRKEAEDYQWILGSLIVWLRPPTGGPWQRVVLCRRNPFVAIPQGWHHCEYTTRTTVFRARTRVDHLIPAADGGNVHTLPMYHWPGELLTLIDPYTIFLDDIS